MLAEVAGELGTTLLEATSMLWSMVASSWGVTYVGDSPDHDIAPVLRLGVPPVLLDGARWHPPDPAYRRIESLDELCSVLLSA